MTDKLVLVEQAQFLLQRKIGATTALCALVKQFDTTATEAEEAVEHARFLLELDREDNI